MAKKYSDDFENTVCQSTTGATIFIFLTQIHMTKA
jgi:hypothetical protein